MSHVDELARQIVVLHREAGFLRLEVPAALCLPASVAAIESGLAQMPGVDSAAVDTGWRRISVRYAADRLTAGQVARALYALLEKLPEAGMPVANAPQVTPSVPVESSTPGLQPLLDKLKAMLQPATPPAEGSLQARFQPLVESALTEKAILNFFNDIVAFYLIRVHWDLITKRWLQNPVAHSNAWLTVFYLVFLLVRYRKT